MKPTYSEFDHRPDPIQDGGVATPSDITSRRHARLVEEHRFDLHRVAFNEFLGLTPVVWDEGLWVSTRGRCSPKPAALLSKPAQRQSTRFAGTPRSTLALIASCVWISERCGTEPCLTLPTTDGVECSSRSMGDTAARGDGRWRSGSSGEALLLPTERVSAAAAELYRWPPCSNHPVMVKVTLQITATAERGGLCVECACDRQITPKSW